MLISPQEGKGVPISKQRLIAKASCTSHLLRFRGRRFALDPKEQAEQQIKISSSAVRNLARP